MHVLQRSPSSSSSSLNFRVFYWKENDRPVNIHSRAFGLAWPTWRSINGRKCKQQKEPLKPKAPTHCFLKMIVILRWSAHVVENSRFFLIHWFIQYQRWSMAQSLTRQWIRRREERMGMPSVHFLWTRLSLRVNINSFFKAGIQPHYSKIQCLISHHSTSSEYSCHSGLEWFESQRTGASLPGPNRVFLKPTSKEGSKESAALCGIPAVRARLTRAE